MYCLGMTVQNQCDQVLFLVMDDNKSLRTGRLLSERHSFAPYCAHLLENLG